MNPRNLISVVFFGYGSAGLSFATQFGLARILTQVEYGTFAFGILLANILQTIVLMGTDRTLIRELVNSQSPKTFFYSQMRQLRAISLWITPIAVAGIIIHERSLGNCVSVVALSISGVMTALCPSVWFDYQNQTLKHSQIIFLEKVLFATSVLVPVLLFGQVSLIYCSVSFLVFASSSCGYQWTYAPMREVFSENLATPKLNGGASVMFASLGNMAMTHANQITLESFQGRAALATFSFAFQITRLSNIFFSLFGRITASRIAASTKQKENAYAMLWKLSGLTFVAAVAFSSLTYVTGSYAIQHFLPKYVDSIPILAILSVWCVAFGVGTIINRFLICLHLESIFLRTALFFGLISYAIGWLLVQPFGAAGIAVALLIGHSASLAYQLSRIIAALNKLPSMSFNNL